MYIVKYPPVSVELLKKCYIDWFLKALCTRS